MNHCPPPLGFKPAGVVKKAFISDTPPPFIHKTRYTGRRAQGVSYERRCQRYLAERYGADYHPSPWLCFWPENQRERWAQPDGLLFNEHGNRLVIVEIKYQHTSDAWWQVERLYRPVLTHLFPHASIDRCEVVKWFDGAKAFPEATALCEDISLVPAGTFGVHIWKP